MEISVLNGAYHGYRYEGSWWRLGGEVHWKVDIQGETGIAARMAGILPPQERGTEDARVRRAIEAFIDRTASASTGTADPDRG
jgi:hypothetical protein